MSKILNQLQVQEHISRYEVGADECSVEDQMDYPYATTCKLHRLVYHFETLEDAEIMCTREAVLNQEDLCFQLCTGVLDNGFSNPVIIKIHGLPIGV